LFVGGGVSSTGKAFVAIKAVVALVVGVSDSSIEESSFFKVLASTMGAERVFDEGFKAHGDLTISNVRA